jgi:hypothetical protein
MSVTNQLPKEQAGYRQDSELLANVVGNSIVYTLYRVVLETLL